MAGLMPFFLAGGSPRPLPGAAPAGMSGGGRTSGVVVSAGTWAAPNAASVDADAVSTASAVGSGGGACAFTCALNNVPRSANVHSHSAKRPAIGDPGRCGIRGRLDVDSAWRAEGVPRSDRLSKRFSVQGRRQLIEPNFVQLQYAPFVVPPLRHVSKSAFSRILMILSRISRAALHCYVKQTKSSFIQSSTATALLDPCHSATPAMQPSKHSSSISYHPPLHITGASTVLYARLRLVPAASPTTGATCVAI